MVTVLDFHEREKSSTHPAQISLIHCRQHMASQDLHRCVGYVEDGIRGKPHGGLDESGRSAGVVNSRNVCLTTERCCVL